jgi:hypothetical protein
MSDAQTYFGLWSAEGIRKVSDLLRSLGVTFEINEYEPTEDILKEWCAWDAGAANPYVGFDFWIRSADLPTVGTHIVKAFPERKFGARDVRAILGVDDTESHSFGDSSPKLLNRNVTRVGRVIQPASRIPLHDDQLGFRCSGHWTSST